MFSLFFWRLEMWTKVWKFEAILCENGDGQELEGIFRKNYTLLCYLLAATGFAICHDTVTKIQVSANFSQNWCKSASEFWILSHLLIFVLFSNVIFQSGYGRICLFGCWHDYFSKVGILIFLKVQTPDRKNSFNK